MRAWVVGVAVIVCVGVVVFAVGADARGDRSGRVRCPPAHKRLLAADAQVVVYQTPPESPEFGALYACSYRTGREYRLGVEPYGSASGSGGVGPIAVAGPFVAYGLEEAGPEGETSRREVWVRNVVTGRVLHRVANGSPSRPGHFGLGTTEAIVVKGDGSVAWIVNAGSEALGVVQVRSVDQAGGHLLAASPEIARSSLALAGSTLYWTAGGKPFSAQLQ